MQVESFDPAVDEAFEASTGTRRKCVHLIAWFAPSGLDGAALTIRRFDWYSGTGRICLECRTLCQVSSNSSAHKAWLDSSFRKLVFTSHPNLGLNFIPWQSRTAELYNRYRNRSSTKAALIR
jgi:hypothetical protein